MATSGSTNFNQTRNDIITAAYQWAGILAPDESVSNTDIVFASDILNRMIKAWQGQGIHLWKNTEATMYFVNGTSKYSLSGAKGANTVYETTLSGAELSGATVIDVTSATGTTNGDVILIELDDDTLHATTISSTSSSAITVASGLASAASSGNNVYWYTTALPDRPLTISSVRLRNDNNQDRVLTRLSRDEYFGLANKATAGSPTSYYYDPQLSTGYLYVYPTPNTVAERLKITYSRSIEDFDASTDNPDFPQEWLETLVYNLALRLAPAFGKDAKAQAILAPLAAQSLRDVLDYDNEAGSITIVPYSRW